MESSPVPIGGVLGDSSGSDGLSEILLDQYSEVDVSSEWLSNFVEECLSSAGTCLQPPKDHQTPTITATNTGTTTNSSKTLKQVKPNNKNRSPTNPKLAVPAKPRGQRRKRKMGSSSKTHKNPLTKWSDQLKQRGTSLHSSFSDPPLLEQTHWLADSELLTMPRKEVEEEEEVVEEEEVEKMEKVEEEISQGQEQVPRRCTHCQSQKTPQWRAGPLGPRTLCNACGMRYSKSGRLLPEYRPANSPTFLSFKHSNSHKKVLEMRMALLSSSTSFDQ